MIKHHMPSFIAFCSSFSFTSDLIGMLQARLCRRRPGDASVMELVEVVKTWLQQRANSDLRMLLKPIITRVTTKSSPSVLSINRCSNDM